MGIDPKKLKSSAAACDQRFYNSQ